MKNLVLVVLAISTTVLAVWCATQSRNRQTFRRELNVVRAELKIKADRVSELEASQERLQHQANELVKVSEAFGAALQARQRAENRTVTAEVGQAETAEAAPSGEGGSFGKMLSNMMQDPEMKKFIREQQRGMLVQIYAPLARKLQLTPEETEKFNDLLADNMLKGAEKAMSLMGKLSSADRTEAVQSLTADQKAAEAEVQAFLGDARFAQYKEYQKTVGERTQLNLYRQQFSGGDTALTDQQGEQLIAFMAEEREHVSASTGQSFPNSAEPNEASLNAMLSEEKMEELLRGQETVNQRVYDRAREVLSPEQLESFGKFQTNQLSMMRMGIGMARKMFAPPSSTGK